MSLRNWPKASPVLKDIVAQRRLPGARPALCQAKLLAPLEAGIIWSPAPTITTSARDDRPRDGQIQGRAVLLSSRAGRPRSSARARRSSLHGRSRSIGRPSSRSSWAARRATSKAKDALRYAPATPSQQTCRRAGPGTRQGWVFKSIGCARRARRAADGALDHARSDIKSPQKSRSISGSQYLRTGHQHRSDGVHGGRADEALSKQITLVPGDASPPAPARMRPAEEQVHEARRYGADHDRGPRHLA